MEALFGDEAEAELLLSGNNTGSLIAEVDRDQLLGPRWMV